MYYAGWQMIAEYNGAGALQRKYVYGPGIDEPVRMTSTGGAGTNYFYLADGLGSVTEITDAAGQLVEGYRYDAYGSPTILDPSTLNSRPSSAIGNRLLFTGRDRDPDTTWYNYRYRYYNPRLGRFAQPDPLRTGGGDANLYRYVEGDPVNRVDTEGRLWSAVLTVVCAGYDTYLVASGQISKAEYGFRMSVNAVALTADVLTAGMGAGTAIRGGALALRAAQSAALIHNANAAAHVVAESARLMSGQGRWWDREDPDSDACQGGTKKMPKGDNTAHNKIEHDALRKAEIDVNSDRARRVHDAIQNRNLQTMEEIYQFIIQNGL